MKSGLEGVDHKAARQWAIAERWVGGGWALTDPGELSPLADGSENFEAYLRLAREVYPTDRGLGKAAAVFGQAMQPDDLCWMYATHTGEYWAGRVESGFAYRIGGDFDTYDMHLTRKCTWALAGTADAVPGVVRRALAGPFGTVTLE